VAIGFADAYPERVRTVVLSDTGPETRRSGALAAVGSSDRIGMVRGFRNAAEALAFYEAAHPEWLPEFRDLHVRYQLRRNWAGKLVLKADRELLWILGSIAKNETAALWDATSRITALTLLCVGETSAFFDDALVQRMQAEFPALTVQYFKTGHYIPRERPGDFIAAVREFFAKHH
jgi:pimeloyl-ACP methyl ester carboxylesterase